MLHAIVLDRASPSAASKS